jgi:hypothetical protein
VGGIEAHGSQIAEGSNFLPPIGRPDGVTTIFKQPEVVAASEVYDGVQVKRVAQGVRNHHCARPFRERRFQLRRIDIVGGDRDIYEDRR